ncbi:class I SAM-dependent methyltransferase [Streptomyces sp. NPDC059176]|uniref:class I SAM-dependent methyltransferase n=1 Tax=Streptomyces sp. NPDC059176 TaxID=3346758 RepID=UPI0036C377D4
MHSPELEAVNARAWTTYGNHHVQRGTEVPEVDRISWGFWPTGLDVKVLGDLAGLRILDLCSGRHAAHLAARGADVTAVDASPSQHQRAVTRRPDTPGLRLVCADAAARPARRRPVRPDLLRVLRSVPGSLPAAARPGQRLCTGRLFFSPLHTDSGGTGPSSEVAPRPEILRLPGTTDDHPVDMWGLTEQLREDLLVQHGLTMEAVTAIDSDKPDNRVSYRRYAARRRRWDRPAGTAGSARARSPSGTETPPGAERSVTCRKAAAPTWV